MQASVNSVSAGEAPAAGLLRPAYRNFVLLMLTAGQSFSFLDRKIITILMPPIKAELQVSDAQLGLMSGLAFAAVYAVFGIPLAQLADRWSRRNLMALAIMFWSAMTTLSGFAQNFTHLVLSRIGVGMGEAGYSPAAFSMLSDYFSRKQRQTAVAVINLGPHIGAVLGLLIGGLAASAVGWRGAFLIAGIPGLLFGLTMLLTVKEPPRGLADGMVTSAPPRPPFLRSVAVLWRISSYRWMVLAGTLFAFAILAQQMWMPSFLSRTHDMELDVIGSLLGLTLIVFAPLGTLLGGVLGDRLGRRDERLSLLLGVAAGLLTVPLLLGALLTDSSTWALLLYGLSFMTASLHFAPVHALIQSTSPVRLRGLAWAFLAMLTSLVGVGLGATSVGALSDALAPRHAEESLRYAMVWMSFSFIPPVICVILASRHLKRDLAAVNTAS